MTSAGIVQTDNGTAGFVQLFYLANPTTGSNTVAVTLSGGPSPAMAGELGQFRLREPDDPHSKYRHEFWGRVLLPPFR